jgi:CHAT domain-containing protein/tetratricopeptide (TPR) repeat protein
MDELLVDVHDILAFAGLRSAAVADSVTRAWNSAPSAENPLAELMSDDAMWWPLLLSGEPLPTTGCLLALGFVAMRYRLLGEAGFLCHLAKVFVDTTNDSTARSRLAEARRQLSSWIQHATQERRALIEPGNEAVDRGALDEAMAIYERALQTLPDDDLAAYELARTRYLRHEISDREYCRLLESVLARNPFFEQAMGQAPTDYAAAFRTRLRTWAHNGNATTADLADFAAGALDAGLGWWSALAYITLGRLDIGLTDRLPDALDAANVPGPVIESSPLSARAQELRSLLAPLRAQFRRQMRHLECGVECPPPLAGPVGEATAHIAERARSRHGETWGAMAETAGAVALSLDALAAGDLATADALAQQALTTPYPNPVEQAHALEVLALVRIALVAETDAIRALDRARDMHVLSGSDVRDQTRVLTHLAAHLQRMGRPQDTRGAMTRSIGLLRSAQNPEPRRLIMSLYYHASCLAELQDLEGGLQSFTEGCSLRTALTSAEVFPPEVIVDGLNAPQRLLDDLCYRERAAYVDLVNVGGTGADVLKALRDWLELAEELERDEAELDGIKHKIAAMLLVTGQVAEAEAVLQDAATSSHVVGAAHPPSESPPGEQAFDPWLEARFAVAHGELERAAELLQQWLEVSRRSEAADSQSNIKVLLALARIWMRLGTGQPLALLSEAADIGFRHVIGLGPMSNSERARESALQAVTVGGLVELAASKGDVEAIRLAAEASVNAKSLGLALSTLLHPTRESSAARETRRQLASRLSALTVRGLDGSIEDFVTVYKSIEKQHRQAQLHGELPAEAAPHWTTIEEIAAGLPAGAVYVDIGLYLASGDTIFHDHPDGQAVSRYAASVITRNGLANWQDLGDTAVFETLGTTFLSQAESALALGHFPQLKAMLAARAEQTCRELWDRTLDQLSIPDDIGMLYLCCDGVFAVLPLECGVMPDGRYAIERYSFVHVLAPGEIATDPVRRGRESRGARLDAVLIGAPDFDDEKTGTTAPVPGSGGRFPIHDELSAKRWPALEGTRIELAMIEKHFPPETRRTFAGIAASKSALAAVDAPRILHLATHAYFLDEEIIVAHDSGENKMTSILEASPDLRSGVVLHGANSRQSLEWTLPDDGVMTAMELAEIDLRGTELVVLSGCETARGGARIWDTVNGLALACHLGGAQAVIASRWKVPDRASLLLFDDFYRHFVDDEFDPALALREAMLDAIRSARSDERPEFTLPHSWAAWSLSTVRPAGRPGPTSR